MAAWPGEVRPERRQPEVVPRRGLGGPGAALDCPNVYNATPDRHDSRSVGCFHPETQTMKQTSKQEKHIR